MHVSGVPEQLYIRESMSGGVVFFDYDGDDFLDLYFVNATRFESDSEPPISHLYRNVPDDDSSKRGFHDVTDSAGVGTSGWGMGATAADYDNDGDLDLFADQLLRGRQHQILAERKSSRPGFSTS